MEKVTRRTKDLHETELKTSPAFKQKSKCAVAIIGFTVDPLIEIFIILYGTTAPTNVHFFNAWRTNKGIFIVAEN